MLLDDDSDDKIRRNLVLSSGLVILSFWLNLNPKVAIEKLFDPHSAGTTESWRIWVAIASLLLYFGMRYRFSAAMDAGIKELKAEWVLIASELVTGTLKKELDDYAKHQNDSSAPSFVIPLSVTFNSNRASNVVPDTITSEHPVIIEAPNKYKPTHGVIAFDSSWRDRLRTGHSYRIKTEYKLPALKRLYFTVRVLSQLSIYSKSSTSLLIPIILNATALIVCAIHIARSYPQ